MVENHRPIDDGRWERLAGTKFRGLGAGSSLLMNHRSQGTPTAAPRGETESRIGCIVLLLDICIRYINQPLK